MDISKFCDKAPGEVVAFGSDHAFVPNPLPPKELSFSDSLWRILGEAKGRVGMLEGIGRTLPNPSLLLQPLARREALQSSRLEGTFASPRELLLYELDPREAGPDESQIQDWQEVFNYRVALNHAVNSDLPLSLRLIRDTHKILMRGVRGKDKAPGEFRRVPVAIGSKTNPRFIPPPADYLSSCLNDFEKFMHTPTFDPLIDCFLVHYQFETIHPFMDGNGRIGRLLMALMFHKRCGLTKPWLYLSGYFEKHRDEYFQRLFEVSAEGKWAEWVEFCLLGTIEQANETIARCDSLRSIREDYLKRLAEVGGNFRLASIVEGLFHTPYIRVTEVADRLSVTYPTAAADLKRLTKAGILSLLPETTPITYCAFEVYDAAYKDIV